MSIKKFYYILLSALLVVQLSLTASFGMGNIPKPDPTPTPPVENPTPPPTTDVKTEQCNKVFYTTETDCYFSKSIATYGTFDSTVGSKKYVVKDYIKADGFEMRDSQSKKVAVVIFQPAKDVAVSLSYPSTGTTTPAPTPDPTPEPDKELVTENGQYRIVGFEVDFYYSKPITAYVPFDLYIDNKKIAAVTGTSYKYGNIEVRNSNSTGKMVVITDTIYKNKTSYIKYYSSEGGTTPPPEDGITESKHFSHINHRSWEGKGTTITFCPGDRMSSVTFHGTSFHFHTMDRLEEGPGREMWTNHYWSGISENGTAGEFIWVDKNTGKKYKHYSDGRGDGLSDYQKHKGDCFGIYK